MTKRTRLLRLTIDLVFPALARVAGHIDQGTELGTTLTNNGDNDNDTLSNTAELARDSSPISADTDGDGLSDAAETRTGTFVNNTNTGTNPRDNDSDDDGLTDGAEVNTHGTNPNDADTDDDTFSMLQKSRLATIRRIRIATQTR